MNSVWKWVLEVTNRQTLMMPMGAQVLCVQTQNGIPALWAQCNTEAPRERRRFATYGTGYQLPAPVGRYVGTYQLPDEALVFHVYEV